MKRIVAAFALLPLCLTIAIPPVFCADGGAANAVVRAVPVSASNSVQISEISVLRSQVAMLRQELDSEKAAREKLQAEMQKKIDFLVGLLNLNSKKDSALEASYRKHAHEYTAPPFGFISKLGFANLPGDSLIPFVSQEKVGHGGNVKTGPPIE